MATFIKKVINADPGTADLVGGDNWDTLDDYFGGIATGLTASIATDTKYGDDRLFIFNPAGTFTYRFSTGAIVANRILSIPLISADDTFALLNVAQTFTQNQKVSFGTLGSQFTIHRGVNSATNLVRQSFSLNDSLSNETEYGRIEGIILDPTDASEDGYFLMSCVRAGAISGLFSINENNDGGTSLGGPNRRVNFLETNLTAVRNFTHPDTAGEVMVKEAAQTPISGDKSFNWNTLRFWNSAATFRYRIAAGSITADRILNLPVITADDTVAVLGLAQTFTQAQTIGAKLDVNKNLVYSGEISPAQLTSAQNNYAPSGWNTSTIIRLDADTSVPYLTGLGDATQAADTIVRLFNKSANLIMLMNQHGGSTAANRFEFGGIDMPLLPKCEVELRYDSTLARWVMLNPDEVIIPPHNFGFYYRDESMAAGTSDGISSIGVAGTGGAVTGLTGEANHPGIRRWSAGTGTTNSGFWITLSTSTLLLGNSSYWRYDCTIRIDTLSDGTNTYTARFGFIDAQSAESTDGLFFRYTHSVNSGKWVLVGRSNSTETTVNATNTAVAAATWYRLTIICYPNGTTSDFFQDGTYLGSVTTNIPTGSGRATGFGMMFLKSAGTTDINIMDMDAMQILNYNNTAR